MTATAPKVWTRDEIINRISTNDRWVERAIVRLYRGQTDEEKQAENTYDHNDIGFNAVSAHVGTYMAKWILSGKRLDGKWMEKARKIALRHVKQLLAFANRDAIANQS